MVQIPSAVRDYARELALQGRSPAYLRLGADGSLKEWGGDWPAYGIDALDEGRPPQERLHFLEGLLPLRHPPVALPSLEIASGVFADVHLFCGADSQQGTWLLLLDASLRVRRSRQRQQQAAQDTLRREECERDLLSLQETFAALDAALLLRSRQGSFGLLGKCPDWFEQLCPGDPPLLPQDGLPFLSNFLIDAERFWQQRTSTRLDSGPWVEADSEGRQHWMEASALCAGRRDILLLQRLGRQFRQRQEVLQKAREVRLGYQLHLKEMEQKEILMHCIIHDISSPLTGVNGALALLQRQELPEKARQHLKTAAAAADRIGLLVRSILDVFGSASPPRAEGLVRADAPACVRQAAQMLAPAYSLEEVGLVLEPQMDWKSPCWVAGETSRLERVLLNLLENALRHSPPKSAVRLGLLREVESCLLTVDDRGPGIADGMAETLFQRFFRGAGKSGKSGLGLYFCRIMVESWGGSIGCSNRPRGGARFWLRLPMQQD